MTNEGEVEKWIPNADEVERPPSSEGTRNEIPQDNRHIGTGVSTPSSSHRNSDADRLDHPELMDNFISLPPKLPAMSSLDSMLNITPYSTNTQNDNDNDEYVIYSDSEIGSQNSLDLNSPHKYIPSDDNDNSPTRDRARRKKGSRSRRSSPRGDYASGDSGRDSPRRESPRRESPRRESHELTTPGKPKKRIRRKSNKSDGSDRFHPIGSGYTLTPGAGKVFRNLLILEESLREQNTQQKGLRRKYLTFMAIMCSLIASIAHHLYFVNHEQQSSTNPLRVILTFVLLALVVTLSLYYLSGEYQKTIVLPRKFLSSTNRGLRQLNIRLVKIKIPLTDRLSDSIRNFLLIIINLCLSLLHRFDPSAEKNKNSKLEVFLVSCQLQCQPRIGIADVKLVLNARVFNTDVREGWELYRSEFWIREGVRRRNDLVSFVTNTSDESILDKEKLLTRDRKERRDRKRSNTNPSPMNKLNDDNLKQLADKLGDIEVAQEIQEANEGEVSPNEITTPSQER